MGNFYKYKCNSCGFKKDYYVGGGFLTEEYFNESEKLEKEFKTDILSGRYGDILKAMVEADTENELVFSRDTQLFQCCNCKVIKVWREKHIGVYWLDKQYYLNVEIKQSCPECGCEVFEKIENFNPICPECKKEQLELVSIGKWD